MQKDNLFSLLLFSLFSLPSPPLSLSRLFSASYSLARYCLSRLNSRSAGLIIRFGSSFAFLPKVPESVGLRLVREVVRPTSLRLVLDPSALVLGGFEERAPEAVLRGARGGGCDDCDWLELLML